MNFMNLGNSSYTKNNNTIMYNQCCVSTPSSTSSTSSNSNRTDLSNLMQLFNRQVLFMVKDKHCTLKSLIIVEASYCLKF